MHAKTFLALLLGGWITTALPATALQQYDVMVTRAQSSTASNIVADFVDTTTGQVTTFAFSGTGAVGDCSGKNSSGTIFSLWANSGLAIPFHLTTLDPASKTRTRGADVTGISSYRVEAAAFDSSDAFWVVGTNLSLGTLDEVYSLDTSTGVATYRGRLTDGPNRVYVKGMAYLGSGPNEGMYCLGELGPTSGQGSLYKLDLNTMAVTYLFPVPLNISTVGMAWDGVSQDDLLFTYVPAGKNTLARVDVTTGSITPVVASQFFVGGALEWIATPPPPPTPQLLLNDLTSPGTGTATVNNATPGGLVGIAYSTALGSSTVNTGAFCGVITTPLNNPKTAAIGAASAGGTYSTTRNVPAGLAGLTVHVWGFDVASCTGTNVVTETL